MSEQKPTVGRIVHFGKYPPEVQAALITGLNHDGTVSLHVFYRCGQFDMEEVAFTPEPAGSEAARGRWTWPARS